MSIKNFLKVTWPISDEKINGFSSTKDYQALSSYADELVGQYLKKYELYLQAKSWYEKIETLQELSSSFQIDIDDKDFADAEHTMHQLGSEKERLGLNALAALKLLAQNGNTHAFGQLAKLYFSNRSIANQYYDSENESIFHEGYVLDCLIHSSHHDIETINNTLTYGFHIEADLKTLFKMMAVILPYHAELPAEAMEYFNDLSDSFYAAVIENVTIFYQQLFKLPDELVTRMLAERHNNAIMNEICINIEEGHKLYSKLSKLVSSSNKNITSGQISYLYSSDSRSTNTFFSGDASSSSDASNTLRVSSGKSNENSTLASSSCDAHVSL